MDKMTFSLSIDELALVYSAINMPEAGIAVLNDYYGKLGKSSIEDKLTTASHSLLSKKLATVNVHGTVVLDENFEKTIFALAKFKNMVQVTRNSKEYPEPIIYNIYINHSGRFTCHSVENGMIHNFSSGDLLALPQVIIGLINLPSNIDPQISENLIQGKNQISGQDFAQLPDMGVNRAARLLKTLGFNDVASEKLADDACNNILRGSIIVSNLSSDNIASADLSSAGAGFLYLAGKSSAWIYSFDEANDNTVGKISVGVADVIQREISTMLTKI